MITIASSLLNSNSHTRWSYITLHLELDGMNGEGVWASFYRWVQVDHGSVCSLSHPLDQTNLGSMVAIFWTCACLHGVMHEVSGQNWEVGQPRERSDDPLSNRWSLPLWWGDDWRHLEWVSAAQFCLARRFASLWAHGTMWLHLEPLRGNTKLIQGLIITLECFTWIMVAWTSWWA
jgi:hypothetical protein